MIEIEAPALTFLLYFEPLDGVSTKFVERSGREVKAKARDKFLEWAKAKNFEAPRFATGEVDGEPVVKMIFDNDADWMVFKLTWGDGSEYKATVSR